MNGKSIFDGLLNLKRQLSSSINGQVTLAELVTDLFMPDPDFTVTDLIDKYYSRSIDTVCSCVQDEAIKLSKSVDSAEINISMNGVNRLTEQTEEVTTTVVMAALKDMELSDTIMSLFSEEQLENYQFNVDFKVTDFVTSITDGMNFNQLISNVNDLFLKNANVDVNSILASMNISGHSENLSNDYNSFKTQLLSLVEDGKLSNYSWAGLISKVSSDSKKSVDEGTMYPTAESPFAILSFVETVVSVASTILPTVLEAIGLMLGGVLYGLVKVLQTVLPWIGALIDIDISFDARKAYPGIKGTYYAGEWKSQDPTISIYGDSTSREHIWMNRVGAVDYFSWLTAISDGIHDDITVNGKKYSYSTLQVQAQPILMYSPDALYSYFNEAGQNRIWYDLDGLLNIKLILKNYNVDDIPVMELSDYIKCQTDSEFRNGCLMASLLVTYLTITAGSTYLLTDGHNQLTFKFSMSTESGNWSFKNILAYIARGSYLTPGISANGIGNNYKRLFDIVSFVLTNEYGQTRSDQTARFIEENLGDTTYDPPFDYDDSKSGIYCSPVLLSENNAQLLPWAQNHQMLYAYDATHLLFVQEKYVYGNLVHVSDECDLVPTEDMVELPGTNLGNLVLAIALVAGVIGLTYLGIKKVTTWFKARKQAKQAKRIADVAAKREAFMQNPNDAQLAKEYRAALRKYDFKAEILGWGDYDSGNGWLNYDDSSGSISQDITFATALSAIRRTIDGQSSLL